MEAQKPAEGILLHRDFGDAKFYNVTCECGCDSEHRIVVEAAEHGAVSVITYTTQSIDWWSKPIADYNKKIENPILDWGDQWLRRLINGTWTRIRVTWKLWTTGNIEYEAALIMSKQQAFNYAETLKTAVQDVEDFQAK